MTFDLRTIRYFVAVAEELHFTKAAERLQMSQPPLSQAIRRLEQDVGEPLFERTNRSVALTPAGAALLVASRQLLEQADEVAEIPRLVAQGHRRRLSIGAVASALTWPLPEALGVLRDRSPEVTVRIHEVDTDEVIDLLADGTIDLAVARLASSREGIRTRVILRDEFCVIAPTTHPAARLPEPLELARLADEPWIWITREVSRDYHDEMAAAFRRAGFSPRPHHSARSIASQIAIVAAGAGLSIVPRNATGELPDGVVVRRIRDATHTVALAVSTRAEPERHEELLAEIVEACVSRGSGA